jgi:hypothetical protein
MPPSEVESTAGSHGPPRFATEQYAARGVPASGRSTGGPGFTQELCISSPNPTESASTATRTPAVACHVKRGGPLAPIGTASLVI